MVSYFENLTSKLYVLNIHVKFHINRILFSIQFVYSSFMYNFKLKKIEFKNLIDDVTIYLWSFWNLVLMEYIRRQCNLMIKFSKSKYSKKSLNSITLVKVTLGVSWTHLSCICCTQKKKKNRKYYFSAHIFGSYNLVLIIFKN